MTVRNSAVALIGAMSVLGLNACKESFKKTPGGLEYSIVKDAPGDNKPSVGDIVEMHMTVRYKDAKTDTTLFDSRKMNNGQSLQFPVPPPSFKGDVAEGFMMLTPGDSAVFKVSLDSVKKSGAVLPEFMKSGERIEYRVVLVSFKSQAKAREEQEAKSAELKSKDDQTLQDYFKQNNLAPQKTASGLYYVMGKPGAGETPKRGQVVTVNYTGRTLDGNVFDSNTDPKFQHVEPFKFILNAGQVIQGWDEGVSLVKKGGSIKLYIPSGLAYGPASPNPGIPANSILTFDVEVLNIEDAPKSQGDNFPAQ